MSTKIKKMHLFYTQQKSRESVASYMHSVWSLAVNRSIEFTGIEEALWQYYIALRVSPQIMMIQIATFRCDTLISFRVLPLSLLTLWTEATIELISNAMLLPV